MVPSINTSPAKGIVSRRQTMISDTSARDANTGNQLRLIPKGYQYSARLGDEITSVDTKPRCWQQSLRYTLTIDSNNALLVIKFALVLQYADDHNTTNEPRFRFTIFNDKGDTIPDCSNYDVFSSNKEIKGFQSYTPPGSQDPIMWRDWTTVGANLLKYIGQTITIEFMSTDCTQQFHFGYAYFIAECHPLYIILNYCAGDSIATLTAPEGFESYKWTGDNTQNSDTTQILRMPDPTEGSSYSCTMTSATGCTVTLQSIIAKYILANEFSSYMIDCFSNTVQLTNLSTTTHGSLLYKWDFGESNYSEERNPIHTFSTSGMHKVRLILANPPSSCIDTLVKDVESFAPPLVGVEGDSTYCPGLSVTLKAYGAFDYTWNDGSKADSLVVSTPGGTFWLVGHSSTGCISDTTYRTITKEPDWIFSTEADTSFCTGDSALLTSYGAASYLWNTGDTTNSIIVKTPGSYEITGANKRGCLKSEIFNITEYPLPAAEFTIEGDPLDRRHNTISCSLESEEGVGYTWDMGDGINESGSIIHHTYNISNTELFYNIELSALSRYGCINNSTRTIDVAPFIPNVFSPNMDGINDIFMPDLDIEIYDRNGILMYKGKDGWDGSYKGRMADPDTYFYSVFYFDKNQSKHCKKGFVTLVN